MVAENSKMPLSMLNEQKRKIKVTINKKAAKMKKGLGLALKKQVGTKFQTHVKAPEETAVESVDQFKTQVEQPENSLLDFGAPLSQPEVKMAGETINSNNFFNFEPASASPAVKKIEPEDDPPREPVSPAPSSMDQKMRKSVFKKGAAAPTEQQKIVSQASAEKAERKSKEHKAKLNSLVS